MGKSRTRLACDKVECVMMITRERCKTSKTLQYTFRTATGFKAPRGAWPAT